MQPEVTNLGFEHFIAQSDSITMFLFAVLILMSITSWMVIFLKIIQAVIEKTKNRAFLRAFAKMESLEDAVAYIKQHKSNTSHGYLTKSGLRAVLYSKQGQSSMSDEEKEAFITSVLRTNLDEIQLHSENGVSVLATVAAAAPFVGLFGTVWGIYHALIEIGSTGAGTIDKVAGPVGEALIMTGLGLAVAIPAVIAYNWIARRNRLKMGRLDSFAFELMTFLKTGARYTFK